MQLNEYLNLFGVSQETIRQVLSEGLSKGGDYCDIFFQHSSSDYGKTIGLKAGTQPAIMIFKRPIGF